MLGDCTLGAVHIFEACRSWGCGIYRTRLEGSKCAAQSLYATTVLCIRQAIRTHVHLLYKCRSRYSALVTQIHNLRRRPFYFAAARVYL